MNTKKNILNDIKSISFQPNHNHSFGLKSAILWARSIHKNSIFPLLYISKPKHISQNDFNLLLDSLVISLKFKK